MTEKKAFELFIELRDFIIEKDIPDDEKKYFLKLLLSDVDFITDGSLRDYIIQQKH